MIRPPLVVGVGKPFKMNAVYSGSPTWSINLGDGSSPTTDINANFTYPAEGVYTIRVTENGVLSTAVIRVIYDEKHFPLELSSLNKSDTFATVVATAPMSGYEQRRRKRTFTRARFNAGLGVKSIDEANILRDFFLSCYGRYKSFYITDYFDYRFSKEQTSVVTNDALTFQIVKRYTEFGGQGFTRNIRNLKNVTVYINDVLVDDEDYTVNLAAGQVTLSGKASTESVISFEGEFVKLCRFDTDEYDHQLMQFVLGVEEGLMQPPSVPILELIQNNFAFVLVTGLSADVLSASEITWSWDSADDPDVVGYEISLDGGSWTDVGDVLIYEGTGFDADTEYGLRVRAYDAAGNRSAASAEVSATTDALPGISVIAATAKGSPTGTGVTTDAIDTTGASLIVIALSSYSQTGAISDSEGNTWAPLTMYGSGAERQQLYYCENPTTDSSHTFTNSGSTNYPALSVIALENAGVYDGEESGNTSASPGSVTPTENDCVVITGLTGNGDSAGVGSGFAIAASADYVVGASMQGAIAYKIQTTVSAESPSWNAGNASSIAVFRKA